MFKIGVILMAFSATLLGNWFTDLFDRTPTPTIKIPIDLSKKGTIVDTVFRVNYKESTVFALDIRCKMSHIDADDCKEVEKFLGLNSYLYDSDERTGIADYREAKRTLGELVDKNYDLDGTKVPLKLSIYRIGDKGDESLVLEKLYHTRGANGSASAKDDRLTYVSREFAITHLERGKYHLKVENMESFTALQGRVVKFRIRNNKIK